MFGCQIAAAVFPHPRAHALIPMYTHIHSRKALWCQFIFGWHAEIRSRNPYKYFHKLSDLNISSDGTKRTSERVKNIHSKREWKNTTSQNFRESIFALATVDTQTTNPLLRRTTFHLVSRRIIIFAQNEKLLEINSHITAGPLPSKWCSGID